MLFFCAFVGTVCLAASAEGARGAKTTKIDATKPTKTQADLRTIVFPPKSIGTLKLVERRGLSRNSWYSYGEIKLAGSAEGVVKVTVPPGYALELEPNRRVCDNPALLRQISGNGIDILRLSFFGIEEGEENSCNRTLSYVNGMTGLRALDLDRSDVTDEGLSQLKNLPHLNSISCFFTSVRGSCFKSLASLPELKALYLRNCKIEPKYLIDLSKLPKLSTLNLDNSRLSQAGAKELSKCSGLVELSLHGNPHFEDSCMNCLASLKKLEHLDVKDTAVTFEGIRALHGIKLKTLMVSQDVLPKQKELQSMFPGVKIHSRESGKIGADEKVIFAPLR
jgi:hypothetical protein